MIKQHTIPTPPKLTYEQRCSPALAQEGPDVTEGQPQLWRELAAGLDLQAEQTAHIVQLRHLFLSKTGAMQRRRRAAAAQLESALPQGDFNSQGGSRSVPHAAAPMLTDPHSELHDTAKPTVPLPVPSASCQASRKAAASHDILSDPSVPLLAPAIVGPAHQAI